MVRCSRLMVVGLVLCYAADIGLAKPPSRFVPGQYEEGELRVVNGLPVVSVAGSPEEIGEQLGVLLKRPIAEIVGYQDQFAEGLGFGQSAGFVRVALKALVATVSPAFPERQQRELAAIAKSAGVEANLLSLGNIVYELSQFPACSTIGVEPARSATGGTLLGRNLDFPTFGFLDKYSLVVIYRPKGKHAFVSVTFPGFVGVVSGMNEKGLCVAQLEVGHSAEPTPRLQVGGTPVAMCFRSLLEDCATIDEAEKLLGAQKRLIMCNLAICDQQGAAGLPKLSGGVKSCWRAGLPSICSIGRFVRGNRWPQSRRRWSDPTVGCAPSSGRR